jgi:hypothetical protein
VAPGSASSNVGSLTFIVPAGWYYEATNTTPNQAGGVPATVIEMTL